MLCVHCFYGLATTKLLLAETGALKLTLQHFTFRHKLSYTIQEKRSNSNISDGVGLALHLFFSLAQENNRLVILRVLALKWNGEKISTSEKDENELFFSEMSVV